MQKVRLLFGSGRPRKTRDSNSSVGKSAAPFVEQPGDYPEWPPPNPLDIQQNRDNYTAAIRKRRFGGPKGAFKDSATFTIYRLYEYFVLDHVIGYRNQLEYFCKQRDWHLHEIPDPDDHDASRSAFLACVVSLLAESFNEKIKYGFQDLLPLSSHQSRPNHLDTPPRQQRRTSAYQNGLQRSSH